MLALALPFPVARCQQQAPVAVAAVVRLTIKSSQAAELGQSPLALLLSMWSAWLGEAVADRVAVVLPQQAEVAVVAALAVSGLVVICLHPLWVQLKLLPLLQAVTVPRLLLRIQVTEKQV